MKTVERYLESLGASKEVIRWARKYKTLASAWDACPQPYWMLWLLRKTLPEKQLSKITKKYEQAEIIARTLLGKRTEAIWEKYYQILNSAGEKYKSAVIAKKPKQTINRLWNNYIQLDCKAYEEYKKAIAVENRKSKRLQANIFRAMVDNPFQLERKRYA
jgi:hypothetical protein